MPKEFAYCSSGCSRPQFEKQINSINRKYPNALIIKESYSKTVTDRSELTKLLAQLERDDTLIVNSMDRLSRDPDELLHYYKRLIEKGVHLIFINQPYMNTDIYTSAYENMMTHSYKSKDEDVDKGLSHLLSAQISRILEKSWEDLQMNRDHMRETYEKSREEEQNAGRTKGKKYESRKSYMVKELIKRYNQNYDGTMNDVQTMEQIRSEMGTISRNTYYKYKKELAREPAN